jgi:hypothetical protein
MGATSLVNVGALEVCPEKTKAGTKRRTEPRTMNFERITRVFIGEANR